MAYRTQLSTAQRGPIGNGLTQPKNLQIGKIYQSGFYNNYLSGSGIVCSLFDRVSYTKIQAFFLQVVTSIAQIS